MWGHLGNDQKDAADKDGEEEDDDESESGQDVWNLDPAK